MNRIMIGKVTRGKSAARLLHYLYGPGRANEHADPHLVAGFGDPAELEPERRPDDSRDLRRLAGLLAQPLAALNGANYAKPVWHCSLQAAPGDRMLSDEEWAQVATDVMQRTGFAPESDDQAVRWVAVRHAPDHIHLVVALARQDRLRPKVWNDFLQVRSACQEAERWFRLRSTAPADRTAARRPSRAESEQAARRGWAEPPRIKLRREVCTAAAGAHTEQEFFIRLTRTGVLIRRRFSTVHPGEVTGYAVSVPEHTAKDGQPIWYSGGKLAADLTLPKLRARWIDPRVRDPLARATPRFTAEECADACDHAARQAAAATEHLHRCVDHDPDQGADVAWAAADALQTAAESFRSPALRCAAADYDRAARAPYGRLPNRTSEGDQLRAAARLLAMTGRSAGDLTTQVVVLIVNPVDLVDAVAELRTVQAHAAQADAAHRASRRLHGAVAEARRYKHYHNQTRTQRPGPNNPAIHVHADFPVPITEVVRTAPADSPSPAPRTQPTQPAHRANPIR